MYLFFITNQEMETFKGNFTGAHCKRRMDNKKAANANRLLMTSVDHSKRNAGMSDPYLELAAKQSGSGGAHGYAPPQYSEIASDHYGAGGGGGGGGGVMSLEEERVSENDDEEEEEDEDEEVEEESRAA